MNLFKKIRLIWTYLHGGIVRLNETDTLILRITNEMRFRNFIEWEGHQKFMRDIKNKSVIVLPPDFEIIGVVKKEKEL